MISIVIPSREPDEALIWATLTSAISDLRASDIEYEILLVLCGPKFPDIAKHIARHGLAKVAYTNADSPQVARHIGISTAKGDTVFCLDAHVVVPPGFFRRVLEDMQATGADLMHTPYKFLQAVSYGYRVAWGAYLWSAEALRQPPSASPFKIAVAGHGAFAVRKESYKRAGGYWLGLRGFGGEEVQLDFKFWLSGMTCWMTPRTYHWHFVANPQRHTEELYKERNFVRNFLLVAAIYGGAEQVEKSYAAMRGRCWGWQDLYPELKEEVLHDAEEERGRVAATGIDSIPALREFLNAEGVAN